MTRSSVPPATALGWVAAWAGMAAEAVADTDLADLAVPAVRVVQAIRSVIWA
jgi:hypothetical protein